MARRKKNKDPDAQIQKYDLYIAWRTMPNVLVNPPVLIDTTAHSEQEKENEMSDIQVQRDYLKRRAETVVFDKRRAARKKFFMDDDFTGLTQADILKMLSDPKAVKFNEGYFNKDGKLRTYEHPQYSFTLVDPRQDEAGYDKTRKQIDSDFQSVKDAIMVFPPEDALKVLNGYETTEY